MVPQVFLRVSTSGEVSRKPSTVSEAILWLNALILLEVSK